MTLLQDGVNSDYIMWKFAQSSVQGRGHVKNNTPCQDKTFTISQNNVYSIVLADGAGSASLSHIGAEGVTKKMGFYLCENFDRLYNLEDANVARDLLMKTIDVELVELAQNNQCEKKDLASTLLAVAVKDEHYIILHIGDGIIGFFDGESIEVASMPENGEFVNSTFFTTSHNAKEHLRLSKGILKNIVGFIMFSDGPEPFLYRHKEKKITSDLTQAFGDIQMAEQTEVEDNLLDTLNEIRNSVTDDCSIVMMSKSRDLHSDTLVDMDSSEANKLDLDGVSIKSDKNELDSSISDNAMRENDVHDALNKSDEENVLPSGNKTADVDRTVTDGLQNQSQGIGKNPINDIETGGEGDTKEVGEHHIEDEKKVKCQPYDSVNLFDNTTNNNSHNKESFLKSIICILLLAVVVLTLLLFF